MMNYEDFQKAMLAQQQGNQLAQQQYGLAQQKDNLERQRDFDWKRDQNDHARMYGRQPSYDVPNYSYHHAVNPNRQQPWQDGTQTPMQQQPFESPKRQQIQRDLNGILQGFMGGDVDAITGIINDSPLASLNDGRAEIVSDPKHGKLLNIYNGAGDIVFTYNQEGLEEQVNDVNNWIGTRPQAIQRFGENPLPSPSGFDLSVPDPDSLEGTRKQGFIRQGDQVYTVDDYMNSFGRQGGQPQGQPPRSTYTDEVFNGFKGQPKTSKGNLR